MTVNEQENHRFNTIAIIQLSIYLFMNKTDLPLELKLAELPV